jgi:hypothetical protein
VSSQIIVSPLGIITQPNKVGSIPVGGMSSALGVYIRSPGTLESSNDWVLMGGLAATSTLPIVYAIDLGDQVLSLVSNSDTTWSSAWMVSSTGATTTAVISPASFSNQYLPTDGRFESATFGEHTIVNAGIGNLVFDKKNPQSTAERTARIAGLRPPQVNSASPLGPGATGALQEPTYCHVTAVLRRKFVGENYELVSAPAPAFVAQTVTGNPADSANYYNITGRIYFDVRFTKAGDILEFYRTRAQAWSYTYTATNTGSDYFLSKVITLTATDISNGYAAYTDVTPDSSLGEALYTNDGVQGAASAALRPPSCKCIATFKGYAFYLNIVEPPILKVKNAVLWGQVNSGVPSSIRAASYGSTYTSGTSTIGSPTITGLPAGYTDDIVAGMAVSGPGSAFSVANARVLSKTATTVTVNVNAAASGTATVQFFDVLEIDGFGYISSSPEVVAQSTQSTLSCGLLSRVYVALPGLGVAQVNTTPADYAVFYKDDNWGDPLTASKYTIGARSTHGDRLDPALPRTENSETARVYSATFSKNGFRWSEENQPENCPATNAAFCGSGEIYAAASTRDALWIFASDGLWRLSGTGGQSGRGYDWRLDPVDRTLVIAGPQACCVLRDYVYALTSRGFVSIDSAGTVLNLSDGRIGDLLRGSGWSAGTWASASCVFLVADDLRNEVIVKQANDSSGSNILWRYNASTDTFTQDFVVASNLPIFGLFNSYYSVPAICASNSNGRIYRVDSSVYKAMTAAFQPIFADDPFGMHHWQQVDIVTEGAFTSLSVSVNTDANVIGTRSSTDQGPSVYARSSFGIPRNSPSVSNSLRLRIQAGSASYFKLQGIQVVYETLSQQRKDR